MPEQPWAATYATIIKKKNVEHTQILRFIQHFSLTADLSFRVLVDLKDFCVAGVLCVWCRDSAGEQTAHRVFVGSRGTNSSSVNFCKEFRGSRGTNSSCENSRELQGFS